MISKSFIQARFAQQANGLNGDVKDEVSHFL